MGCRQVGTALPLSIEAWDAKPRLWALEAGLPAVLGGGDKSLGSEGIMPGPMRAAWDGEGAGV